MVTEQAWVKEMREAEAKRKIAKAEAKVKTETQAKVKRKAEKIKEFTEIGAGIRKLQTKIFPTKKTTKKITKRELRLLKKLEGRKIGIGIRRLGEKIGRRLGTPVRIRKPRPQKPTQIILPAGAMTSFEAVKLREVEKEEAYQINRIAQLQQRRLNIAKRKNRNRELERIKNKLDREKFNIMKSHEQNDNISMDFLSVDKSNSILRSENIMQDRPDSIRILQKRNNILDTRSAGNDLHF